MSSKKKLLVKLIESYQNISDLYVLLAEGDTQYVEGEYNAYGTVLEHIYMSKKKLKKHIALNKKLMKEMK